MTKTEFIYGYGSNNHFEFNPSSSSAVYNTINFPKKLLVKADVIYGQLIRNKLILLFLDKQLSTPPLKITLRLAIDMSKFATPQQITFREKLRISISDNFV